MSKLSTFSRSLIGIFVKKIFLAGTKSTCGGLLVEHKFSLDQFYNCTVMMLCSLYTPIWHFVVPSAHTLPGPVCCATWYYIQTFVVHTLYLDQLYIYILVQPLYTLRLCTQLHCTSIHSPVTVWLPFCQPITNAKIMSGRPCTRVTCKRSFPECVPPFLEDDINEVWYYISFPRTVSVRVEK